MKSIKNESKQVRMKLPEDVKGFRCTQGLQQHMFHVHISMSKTETKREKMKI